jgi:hypothetical protein
VTKKTMLYMMSVLTYYRSEWTEVSDDDRDYRLFVAEELKTLIRTCMKRGLNVPNAAKEVEIFLDLQAARAESAAIESDPRKKPQIKFRTPSEESRAEHDSEEHGDGPDGRGQN